MTKEMRMVFRKFRVAKLLVLVVFCSCLYCVLMWLIKLQYPWKVQHGTEQRALEQIFQSRSAHVRSECAASTPPHYYTDVILKTALKDLLYIPHRNITWCIVPKVASTSMSRALLEADSSFPPYYDPLQIVLRDTFRPVEPSKINETINTSIRFLFVRHPFHRLVSAYRNKLEDSMNLEDGEYFYETYGKFIVEKYGIKRRKVMNSLTQTDNKIIEKKRDIPEKNRVKTVWGIKPNPEEKDMQRANKAKRNFFDGNKREPTFQEYVEYLLNTDPYEYDEHWKPITLQCHACHFHYDYIIKFENFKEEIEYLLKLLKEMGRVPKDFTLEWENKGGTDGETVGKYLHQISQDKLGKLFDKYRHDFLSFDYSMEEFTRHDKMYTL